MVCHERPAPTSSTTAACGGRPRKSPPESFGWEDGYNEHRYHSCSCSSIDSLLDLPESVDLGDSSVHGTSTDSARLDYQPWRWPELLISDEMLSPSSHDLDSMGSVYSLPSWDNVGLEFDSILDQYLPLDPLVKDVLSGSLIPFDEGGHLSRSLSSASSSQSDENMWEGDSARGGDFSPLDRSGSRSPKWVTKKRSGVSKAAAHNLIEKKYRSNLNEKMSALRDTIPSLRSMAENSPEDADSQGPSRKLNKAYILTEARDYILYLKKRNDSLTRKEKDLEARIKAFQMLSRSRCAKK